MADNSLSLPADARRRIPSVDKILQAPPAAALIETYGRPPVVQSVQSVLDALRNAPGADVSESALLVLVENHLREKAAPSLKKVVNATGIVLHTGLGRAVLSPRAQQAVARAAANYCNLEIDLETGARGSRQALVESLIRELVGAQAALAVNNCAAAVVLTLNTLALHREVLVSRGELVEIGGSFRMPAIMERSGALLREVGTTNRTRLADFEAALGGNTALVLKVHTSNYHIVGFTEEVPLEELVRLGRPVVYDLGSGALVPIPVGVEPLARDALAAGAAIVTFSADKLLGGPQAGIIAGARDLVDQIKKNPLARAFRVCKLTLAALEATLREYLTSPDIFSDNPTLRALTRTVGAEEIDKKIHELRDATGAAPAAGATTGFEFEALDGASLTGGGAHPGAEIPTRLIAVRSSGISAEELARRLRLSQPPIVARINADRVLIDPRTVTEEDWQLVVEAFKKAGRG